MTAKSGSHTLDQYPRGYRWFAFKSDIDDDDAICYVWRRDDGTEVVRQYTEHAMYKTAPKIMPNPTVANQVLVFYANANKQLRALRVIFDMDQEDATYQKLGLAYRDGNKRRECGQRAVAVHSIGDGVLATHTSADGERLWVSFFSFADLATADGVVATYSHEIPLGEGADIDLRYQGSAVVPDQDRGGLRLVCAFKHGDQQFTTYEFTLDETYCPKLVSGAKTVSTTAPIKTDYPAMHTGLDGRAYISFFSGDDAHLTYLIRDLDDDQRAVWDEVANSNVSKVRNKGLREQSAPTVSYSATPAPPPASGRARLEPSRVTVTRLVTLTVQDGDKIQWSQDFFGTACREVLPKIPADDVDPILLGVIEGTPPLSNEVINDRDDLINLVYSKVSIVFNETERTSESVTNTFTSMVRVGASVGVSSGVDGIAKVELEQSVSLATKYLYESTYSHFEKYTKSTTINPKQRPEKTAGGRYQQPQQGNAYILRSAVIGYAYYLLPQGIHNLEQLPRAVPVLYQFGTSEMAIESHSYDIDPNDVVPGNIHSYASPERKRKLDSLGPWTHPDGDLPYMTWNSSSGTDVHVTPAFAYGDSHVSKSSVDITVAATTRWRTELGIGIAAVTNSSELTVELGHTLGRERTGEREYEFMILPEMEQPGDSSESLDGYTTKIYFIKPNDDSRKSAELRDGWIRGLREHTTADNRKLHAALWDETRNETRVPKSNPWFVHYLVTNINENK